MVTAILVVCTANICRSPLAEAALRARLPGIAVSSAGVAALSGHEMDPGARAAALAVGLDVPAHAARQLDAGIGRAADVILVMERMHRQVIAQRFPHFLGKTFLLGRFLGERDVPDPYRRGSAAHLQAAEMILACADQWGERLEGMTA